MMILDIRVSRRAEKQTEDPTLAALTDARFKMNDG